VSVAPTVTCAASQLQAEQPIVARPTAAAEGTKQNNGDMAVADTTEGEYMFTVKFSYRRI
jgi:alpha/beta superfamily hydrolase